MADKISMVYLQQAAKVLTTSEDAGGGGLSGGQAVELTVAYGYDFGVEVKYVRYPNNAPNKRTMLLDVQSRVIIFPVEAGHFSEPGM